MNSTLQLRRRLLGFVGAAIILVGFGMSTPVQAATQNPGPVSGSVGLEGTIQQPPPTTAPVIAVPTNGQTFTTEPITVSGLCKSGLIVKLFSNGIFIGAAECTNGSFTITASLFDGQNQLVAQLYDSLGQQGPDSTVVTVTYNSSANSFGSQLTLISAYAERGANPNSQISWPITIAGGDAPYALSVDWGDATEAELISQRTVGTFTATHTYKQAGIYTVLVKATDQLNDIAYLQLIGVGNGAIGTGNTATNPTPTVTTKILWEPAALAIPIIIAAFWIGRRYELGSLRKRIEQTYQD